MKRKGCSDHGVAEDTLIAAGDGWRVRDIVCTAGPNDRPYEERFLSTSISLVLSGTLGYRSERGSSLLSSGMLLLGNVGHAFECSHEHGEGDRCLSFQFDPDLFERIAEDVRAPKPAFDRDRLPPSRALAPTFARAGLMVDRGDSCEEIALDLAGAVLRMACGRPLDTPSTSSRDRARIARVLNQIQSGVGEEYSLSELARTAGLSRYHFLRTFTRVTGVTPHQWLMRMRLRDAAEMLATTRAPVTEVALDVGFADLSNFIRSFRAEFGVSPSRYRLTA